jgi:hypothetical protein
MAKSDKNKGEEGLKLLFQAIRENKRLKVISLLEEQDEHLIEATDQYGNTALHYACGSSVLAFDILKILVEAYPEAAALKNQSRYTPLRIAIDRMAPQRIILYLVERYPISVCVASHLGETPLHMGTRRFDMKSNIMKQMQDAACVLIECMTHTLPGARRSSLRGTLVLTHQHMSLPKVFKLLKNSQLQELIQEELFQELVNDVYAMNKAGRSYIQNDACNKVRGIRVLETVNDNVDCLFWHLQENPALCKTTALPIRASITARSALTDSIKEIEGWLEEDPDEIKTEIVELRNSVVLPRRMSRVATREMPTTRRAVSPKKVRPKTNEGETAPKSPKATRRQKANEEEAAPKPKAPISPKAGRRKTNEGETLPKATSRRKTNEGETAPRAPISPKSTTGRRKTTEGEGSPKASSLSPIATKSRATSSSEGQRNSPTREKSKSPPRKPLGAAKSPKATRRISSVGETVSPSATKSRATSSSKGQRKSPTRKKSKSPPRKPLRGALGRRTLMSLELPEKDDPSEWDQSAPSKDLTAGDLLDYL